MTEDSEIK